MLLVGGSSHESLVGNNPGEFASPTMWGPLLRYVCWFMTAHLTMVITTINPNVSYCSYVHQLNAIDWGLHIVDK